MSGGIKLDKKAQYRLYLSLTFESKPDRFGEREFCALIESALKTNLGEAGRSRLTDSQVSYSPEKRQGSLSLPGSELHSTWGALSLYGQHLGESIALRVHKVTKVKDQ